MTTPTGYYFALAILVGVLGGIHVPINGALGVKIHSALVATFAFYGIAFLLVSIACLVRLDAAAFHALAGAPRWYLVAGVISAIVVGSSTYLIPRLGAINLFVVVLAAQLIARLVISHFGWFESPVSPISPAKLAGGLLLLAGAVLVIRD